MVISGGFGGAVWVWVSGQWVSRLLSENVWLIRSKTSYSGNVTDVGLTENNKTKQGNDIRLLSF